MTDANKSEATQSATFRRFIARLLLTTRVSTCHEQRDDRGGRRVAHNRYLIGIYVERFCIAANVEQSFARIPKR